MVFGCGWMAEKRVRSVDTFILLADNQGFFIILIWIKLISFFLSSPHRYIICIFSRSFRFIFVLVIRDALGKFVIPIQKSGNLNFQFTQQCRATENTTPTKNTEKNAMPHKDNFVKSTLFIIQCVERMLVGSRYGGPVCVCYTLPSCRYMCCHIPLPETTYTLRWNEFKRRSGSSSSKKKEQPSHIFSYYIVWCTHK